MRKRIGLAVAFALVCALAGCAQRSVRRAPPDQFTRQATPRLVQQVAPEYPAGFCSRGPGRAVVKVMALVGTDGTVENARVMRSVPGFDAAAIACVRRWRFTPGRSEYGQVLKVWTPVDVRWDCRKRR